MQFPNISPVAFTIFGFDIRWYALAYIFGFLIALSYLKYLLRHNTNNTISYSELDDFFTYIVLGVVFGGRLGYVLFYNFGYYIQNPVQIFKIWHGGMSFHGGCIGCVLATYLWCKANKKKFLYLADFFCMCVPIGLFLGRIANFINGELYGRITTSKIGIIFPYTDGLPRHPSQLYEAFAEGILLFITLNLLHKIKAIKNRYGITAFSFIGLYGLARIIIENFREPDAQIGFLKFGITMGQLLTIPMIIVSIFAIIYLLTKKKETEVFVSSPLLETKSIKTRFFTRCLGVSSGVFANANCKFETSDSKENIIKNRELLLNTIDLNNKDLLTVNQQHTNKILVITTPIKDTSKYLSNELDGIITNQKNLAIGILTADCVPVLLSDETKGLISAVHCGWQGIYKDIIHETINEFKKLGSNTKDIKVALGPCLKQKSYEVDKDFVEKITAQNKTFSKFFKRKNETKYLFNCTQYCKQKLLNEGIKNIEVLDFNTYTNKDLFFSYRRSVINHEYANNTPTDEGRQLSLIVMK